MSLNKKTFTIGKLREIIRELIIQNLEEASTTSNIDGGEGPPKTPFAFSGKRKKDKKKEKEVATNSTGFKVVKESVNESVKRQYRDVYSKYYKTYKAFATGVMDLAKSISKISGDKTDERVILKNFTKQIIPFAGLMRSWSRGRESNPHIDESVNEGRYHSYRNDDTLTPRQKIGRSMREVRDSLSGLEKLVKMNVRLKNELNVDSRSYWKTTHKALQKISGRLIKLSTKVGEMK
jgi:hypothetical protein